MTVRTRIAPSPTGEYHIGHLRTCLYDYAFARQNQGQFVLRIENTDQKRFVEGAQERIMKDIKDYGLNWDEGPDIGGSFGPYVQTDRLDLYQKYIQQLLDAGHAYYCFCTEERLTEMRTAQKALKRIPKYDRHCLSLTKEEIDQNLKAKVPYVIRMKVPDNQVVEFTDAVRGTIKINTRDMEDQVLVKSNGIPTYHFAVVIDDHLMNISHIFRGEEWITSTPKQILLYQFFGWEIPVFVHLTVLLDPSGHGKMSKRKGSVSARSFLNDGYLPEALLNFLMLLGWNPGDNREIFSLDEFIKEFSLTKLHKKSPIFDRKKLDYLNGLYIRQKSDADLVKLLAPFVPKLSPDTLLKIVPLIKERLTKLNDATSLLAYLTDDVAPKVEDLTNNGKIDKIDAAGMLSRSVELLSSFSDFSDIDSLKNKLLELIKTNNWKTGDFFMVFRVAITGTRITPPIFRDLGFPEKKHGYQPPQCRQKTPLMLLLLLLLLLVRPSTVHAADAIQLAKFKAINSSGDWIQIHNTSNTAVDLSGYSVTDTTTTNHVNFNCILAANS